jgi:hypothetical protein
MIQTHLWRELPMDMLTMWLGLVLFGCSLVGWLTSIYLSRRRKQRRADEGTKTVNPCGGGHP